MLTDERRKTKKDIHIYPTMMKLGTVIPYLEKVKKKYKSLNIPFNSVDISIFFSGNMIQTLIAF